MMVAVGGDTVTVATEGGVTVNVACPVLAPAVAMITTCPAATALTCPDALTVAIDDEPETQVTAPTAIGAPFWSSPAAVAVVEVPVTMEFDASVTLRVVRTGGGGAAGPSLPPPLQDTSIQAQAACKTPRRRTRDGVNGVLWGLDIETTF